MQPKKRLSFDSIQSQYNEEIIIQYQIIRQHLFRHFNAIIPDEDVSLNLIDVGCGEATALLDTVIRLAGKVRPIEIRALGIDQSKKSIMSCTANQRDNGFAKVDYQVRDAKEIRSCLQSFRNVPAHGQQKKSISYVFFSGSMTESVLGTAFDALQILQAC